MGKLDGKIALVTGGNGGIGLATAKRFVAEGAYVFITGRREAELNVAVREISQNVAGVQSDVSRLADLDRLYAQIKRDKGHLDIVFANAGIARYAPLGAISEELYEAIFWRQREGRAVHCAEGVTAAARRGRDCPERLHRCQQGATGEQRLRRDEGRGALLRSNLGH
jgi:NAD(P)-dependent dehydrogenase (short-subunit alcohol dehydrogenase family)